MTHSKTGPLSGSLVVALEQAVAAPFCTSRLADAGARVIKVERKGSGDFARGYDTAANGESAYFTWLNRGKESVALDIKADEDREILLRMLENADVFIQNLLPGALAKLGLDSASLRERFPRLVTCDITGYGEDGPVRNAKAYDLLVQCESGLASVTGTPDGPGRVGVSVCDIATGMTAHAGICEALVGRDRTGKGSGVSVAMFDVMADWPSERRLLLCAEAGEARPIAAVLGELAAAGAGEAPGAVLTGPEGGFAPGELDGLLKLPFVTPVGLGPRVLRADTAALAALATWQAILGDGAARP